MDRSAFRNGVRDIVPAIPPNVPYGMLFGAAAVNVGLDPAQATALSLFTFAATAQIAAVELLAEDAAVPVVVATAFVINLRYVVYSASLAPHVRHLSRSWRAIIAYPLFDITYALAIARFQEAEDGIGDHGNKPEVKDGGEPQRRGKQGHRGWYYLGIAVPFVFTFTFSTLLGTVFGRTVGDGLNLNFAIPLIFMALLVPTMEGRASIVTAIVAAVIAVVAAGLPFNVGLLLGLCLGTAAGVVTSSVNVSEGRA